MVLPVENDMNISDEKLNEVDTVWQLVRGLSSSDDKTVADAVKSADKYLSSKNSAFSRTFINNSTDSHSNNGHINEQVSADVTAFMQAVEKDATERSKRRAQQRTRAEKLKDRANTFFKTGDWRRAIELYTQAIELCKDWEVLYTNRAQAHLRSGSASAALADCDTALELYLFHQSNAESEKGDAVKPSPMIAKTHFHRGKALMALGRPEDALTAYTHSKDYCTTKTTETWPPYLVEYVAQAQAAVIAKQADARTEADFSARTTIPGTMPDLADNSSVPLSNQLVCLLAKLARGNQDLTYYSAGLRQLTRLFASAPLADPNQTVTTTAPFESPQPNVCRPTPAGSRSGGRGKKRGTQTAKSNGSQSSTIEDSSVKSVETLADLQTLFRVKKGFSIMGREVNVICQIVDQPEVALTAHPSQHAHSSTKESTSSTPDSEDISDRLLAVLNLAGWITRDCAENQRLLIDQHPMLVSLVVNCMTLSPEFVRKFVPQMPKPQLSNQSRRHKLESLRNASTDLLVTLTSEPSGRQALLNNFGAGTLLDALAVCLAESFGHIPETTKSASVRPDRSLANGLENCLRRKLSTSAQSASNTSAISALCAARAAQILENLTESPGFLLAARSSVTSLESLLSVIESALSVSGAGTRTLTTTIRSLSSLLDGLSSACHDDALRANLFQRRQPMLTALAECLQRHAPLLSDPGHAQLVGSLCRLLHNICVGQLHSKGETNHLSSYLSSGRLSDTLLNAVGAVLEQPGHGPELRAVAIALAGRLLPLCSQQRVLSWFGEPTTGLGKTAETEKVISERGRLLLAILDSCSLPSTKEKLNTNQPPASAVAIQTDVHPNHDQDQLSAHLLGGCIRCLAAATTHSVTMRYAIGDDRRRVRRLARLIRSKLPLSSPQMNSRSSACSDPPVPRDEPLAGNACLILQHCCDDTPLAENLQGTSVILDLLQLIQESKSVEAKRNAAILIGKLAQASHNHREELSRLDGWSVLTPFNSWNACLGHG